MSASMTPQQLTAMAPTNNQSASTVGRDEAHETNIELDDNATSSMTADAKRLKFQQQETDQVLRHRGGCLDCGDFSCCCIPIPCTIA
ncbi:hypothetical protein ACM66B_005063 [Microbotryomycetes sp. NB124-2]